MTDNTQMSLMMLAQHVYVNFHPVVVQTAFWLDIYHTTVESGPISDDLVHDYKFRG